MSSAGRTWPRFYLMGMGRRRKLVYVAGRLLDPVSGELLATWPVASEKFLPGVYRVELTLTDGRPVELSEDEQGIWLRDGERFECLSAAPVELPDFVGHRQAPALRALHQEILANVHDGRPLPNCLAYDKPWYRDAAVVAMVLARTGNLGLIADWIEGLAEPFDRNNRNNPEPDNLGQALYLISLVSDRSHPLVDRVLAILPDYLEADHLAGLTNFGSHPVYQTKWLKYGLRALGLDDAAYRIPAVFDGYSALFWPDYRDQHVDGPRSDYLSQQRYPYLPWAEAHFHNEPPPQAIDLESSPLSWEMEASEARYAALAAIDPALAEHRIALPHAWHAAEMFLYLMERG